ncbi:aldehyde dehydrogenase [Streptomyces millisiae]|uniref:Aldehyde dehydrogenase n=1 Tax=Streptomyces millisiae TaxID=3075542 RepID=A0ABU2LZC8_9ACTN|nr:aldehyde dehydrogenase [Streptomyces sp. DSM 44918]MDT0322943.1 aldehyde dehydrogenase [Streptomyces sp. DSM 44918]
MRDRSDWQRLARDVRPRHRAFIDGAFTDAADGAEFDTVNPATGGVLASVARCRAVDVDRAVTAARRAFDAGSWSRAVPGHRKAVLLALAEKIREHADELALLDTLDGGKLITDTTTIDVPGSAAILQWYAEAVDKLYGQVAPTGPGDLAIVTREALGVVGAVVPWNYPLEMAIWKIAPALAVGNSVVLKPAEQSPLSALRLAELAAEAGLPDGVLSVLPGLGPEAGRAIGEHPGIDAVAFTGSTAVGKLFLRYAAESNMKQVWLECGGKSANVVFADAGDLDLVADRAVAGIYTCSGQVCSANSRLLVAESVADELTGRIAERAGALRVGDPLDPESTMGPLISRRQLDGVLGHIEAARAEARLAFGGRRLLGETDGYFIEPTAFVDVPDTAAIARDEVFGPVLAISTFRTEEEAIARVNASRYGLAASVFTDDIHRAHRVARALQVGTVSVNTVDALDVTTPFGGVKQSGYGRDLSLHALDKFTSLKTTWFAGSPQGSPEGRA